MMLLYGETLDRLCVHLKMYLVHIKLALVQKSQMTAKVGDHSVCLFRHYYISCSRYNIKSQIFKTVKNI